MVDTGGFTGGSADEVNLVDIQGTDGIIRLDRLLPILRLCRDKVYVMLRNMMLFYIDELSAFGPNQGAQNVARAGFSGIAQGRV